MKKKIYTINNFIILLSLVAFLWGCGNNKVSEEKGIFVYYTNKDGTKIEQEEYSLQETNTRECIGELLDKLHNNGEKKEHLGAIPQKVTIRGYDITDGIALVDFTESYTEMNTQRELLCRAAVVLTLSQIKDVDYVAFTINDRPYSRKDGVVVGNMKASDFVADLGGGNNIFATSDFKLYFANQKGTKLKEYVLLDTIYGEKSKEQFIVEQLIKGPEKKGYMATLSPNLELISVVTANNICYVNFADNFATEQSKVSNQLVIFSIVNSLSELTDVHKVQISINGDSVLKYHDDISLTEPFVRNLDIIEVKQ